MQNEITIRLRTPHEAQQRVLDEARRFNVVACGRRWGKTEMGCEDLAVEPALERGWRIGWFAPSYKLLGDAWGYITKLVKPMGKLVKVNGSDKRITFPSGGCIEFWSTEPQIAGDEDSDVARGRKYHRIIYDEAARARRLEQDWTKAIRATLADYKGDAWFFSTPKGHNFFHKMWTRGQSGDPKWMSWQMPTAANPYIDAEEIEDAQGELPDDAFSQEYLAEFLSDAANPFGIHAIRACIKDMQQGPPVAWGVDLAKAKDWTVAIALNARGDVCGYQRWQNTWLNIMARLKAMIGTAPALVDATGVGDPIVEQLQQACPGVEGYKFTSTSKQVLFEGLAVGIQQGRIGYPAGPIVNELETFMYEYRPTGVRYTAPDGMHDDCVDALALAWHCYTQTPPELSLSLLDRDEDDGSAWGREAIMERDDAWS